MANHKSGYYVWETSKYKHMLKSLKYEKYLQDLVCDIYTHTHASECMCVCTY